MSLKFPCFTLFCLLQELMLLQVTGSHLQVILYPSHPTMAKVHELAMVVSKTSGFLRLTAFLPHRQPCLLKPVPGPTSISRGHTKQHNWHHLTYDVWPKEVPGVSGPMEIKLHLYRGLSIYGSPSQNSSQLPKLAYFSLTSCASQPSSALLNNITGTPLLFSSHLEY